MRSIPRRSLPALVAMVAATIPGAALAVGSSFCAGETDALVCEDFSAGNLAGFHVYQNVGGNGPFRISVQNQHVVFAFTGGFDAASVISKTLIDVSDVIEEGDVITDGLERSLGGITLEATDGSRSTMIVWALQADEQTGYLWVEGPGVSYFGGVPVTVTANVPYHLKTEVIGQHEVRCSVNGTVMLDLSIDLSGLSTVSPGFHGNSYGPNKSFTNLVVRKRASSVPVRIDIKPGSIGNCIRPDGHGIVPVVVFGSKDVDVAQIDLASLNLQGLAVKFVGMGNRYLAHIGDVDGDGLLDLTVQFADSDSWVAPGGHRARLTGQLADGRAIAGSDRICILPDPQQER